VMAQEELVTIRLPKLGESILSATVVQWMKKVGESVAVDEPLMEVATDKVNSEIPSPVAGVIEEILVDVDTEVEIGAPLATIRPSGAAAPAPEPTAPEPAYEGQAEHHEATKGFLSPAVLKLVRERGIPLEELDHIKGTGHGGRITKKDVESYATARWDRPKAPEPEPLSSEEFHRVPMSPMRKAIADNMVRSFYQAPHAYLVSQVDITLLMRAIAAHKAAFLEKYGFKLTITAFIVKAIARAVQECPHINASLDGDELILKRDCNVGVAVAVGDGLLVPVIKRTGSKSIVDIAGAIGDLSVRARKQQLKPDEVMDGSITLTNFGMSGAMIGLPIIRYPEVAILGVGAIEKRVAVFDNDQFGIRQVIHATLSFDHRAVDGMYAGRFIKAFEDALEGMHNEELFKQ
jgi:2-oxoglutarate dehydrogenase E2 component (dihydrolipoamide succinyltransferase)